MIFYEAWFDGCCEPRNPGGYAGYGAVVVLNKSRLWDYSGYLPASPQTSNNVAEYMAFLEILKWFKNEDLNRQPIIIRGDSKLVIKQMFGRWKMRRGLYIPYAQKAKSLLKDFPNTRGEWIPREKNSIADELSKRELISRGVEFRIQPN